MSLSNRLQSTVYTTIYNPIPIAYRMQMATLWLMWLRLFPSTSQFWSPYMLQHPQGGPVSVPLSHVAPTAREVSARLQHSEETGVTAGGVKPQKYHPSSFPWHAGKWTIESSVTFLAINLHSQIEESPAIHGWWPEGSFRSKESIKLWRSMKWCLQSSSRNINCLNHPRPFDGRNSYLWLWTHLSEKFLSVLILSLLWRFNHPTVSYIKHHQTLSPYLCPSSSCSKPNRFGLQNTI